MLIFDNCCSGINCKKCEEVIRYNLASHYYLNSSIYGKMSFSNIENNQRIFLLKQFSPKWFSYKYNNLIFSYIRKAVLYPCLGCCFYIGIFM